MRLPESKLRRSTVALGVAFDLLLALYFLVRPDPNTVLVPVTREQVTTAPAPSASRTPSRSTPTPSPSVGSTRPSAQPSPSATPSTAGTPSPTTPPSQSSSLAPSATAPTLTGRPGSGLLHFGSPAPSPTPDPASGSASSAVPSSPSAGLTP